MTTPIFLASGNRMKRVMWQGPRGTWGDLAAAHKKGTSRNPLRERTTTKQSRNAVPFACVAQGGRSCSKRWLQRAWK